MKLIVSILAFLIIYSSVSAQDSGQINPALTPNSSIIALPQNIFKFLSSKDKKIYLAGFFEVRSLTDKRHFQISDEQTSVQIEGVAPDLLFQGDPVLVAGYMDDNMFIATSIWALTYTSACQYIPNEIVKELKSIGLFFCMKTS